MSPTNLTTSFASHGRAIAGLANGAPGGMGWRSMSSAVYTATTPAAARASDASIERMRAWAIGERTYTMWTAPSSGRSST